MVNRWGVPIWGFSTVALSGPGMAPAFPADATLMGVYVREARIGWADRSTQIVMVWEGRHRSLYVMRLAGEEAGQPEVGSVDVVELPDAKTPWEGAELSADGNWVVLAAPDAPDPNRATREVISFVSRRGETVGSCELSLDAYEGPAARAVWQLELSDDAAYVAAVAGRTAYVLRSPAGKRADSKSRPER